MGLPHVVFLYVSCLIFKSSVDRGIPSFTAAPLPLSAGAWSATALKGWVSGRFLLMYRIREIGKAGTVGLVFAHSPRPSVDFFEKQGFRVNGIEKDACAPGVDRVELIRKLTVCP